MLPKLARLYKSGTLGLAVKGEIGNIICMMGEKFGSERLIYNAWTYAIFHRAALEASPTMISGIVEIFPEARSLVDFGCGSGAYVSEFRKRGLAAEGFEYSDIARKLASESFGIEIQPFDLAVFQRLERSFDIALSLEVAEHLTPEMGSRLVEVCCEHAQKVVFSAAPPGQHGHGHINPQHKPYWIEQFARFGFRHDDAATIRLEHHLRANLVRGFWLANNVGVYVAESH